MSYYNDFLKELKKRGLTVEDVTDKSPGSKSSGSSGKSSKGGSSINIGNDSFANEFKAELGKRGLTLEDAMWEDDEKEITPRTRVWDKFDDEDDIAPVKKDNDSRLDFFQKGAFEDGYQFGDVTKSILGTVGDVGLGAAKGIAGLAEGVGDLIAYGVAGVADVAGKDRYAEGVRKRASESLVDKMTKDADDFLNQYSVLGRTSDSITQGIGQVGGILLTGGLGAAAGLGTAATTALTTGLMGLSGMGSGMSEAYQSGATDEEAALYGAISGAADALSELVFGGLGKAVKATGLSTGLSSADDMLAKKVSSLFSSHLAKNLSSFGIKAGAEGFEEIIAGTAQAVGKKLTYMSEEDLGEILKDENLLEQFVVGAVTSGIAQSGVVPGMSEGSLKESIQTGRDFITGFSQNEQAVIKKEVENRIAEQEKDGKKLTAKEKSAIEAQVEKDMEKGYISTDTIEEVLGGETYKSYRDTIDSEDALQNEFDTLNKMKQGEMTGEQIDRRTELKDRLKEIKEKSQRNQLKSQLGEEVFSLVQGDRLAESYNERSRRSQAFTADLSKYDEKQKAVIQKAADSGILNNTNRTHEFVDMVAKISADKGVLFDFTNNAKLKESGFAIDGKTVNGFVTKDGITINVQSSKSLNSLVGHEITHVLEGTDLYTELQNVVVEYAKTKGDYQGRYDNLSKLYESVEGANIDAELTADLVGDYLFTDSDFINNLSTNHRNVFQKIYDEVKYLLKVATAGSKEAKELAKVKRAFEKAYKADTNASTDTKYSLTSEQQEYFKDSKVRDEDGNLKVMYHGTSKGGYTVFDTYGSNYGLFGQGSYFTDNKDVAQSYTKKGKGKNPQVYESYLNIKNPMDMDAPADPAAWAKAFPDAAFPESGTNEDFYRAMEEYLEDEMLPKWEAAEEAMLSIQGMGYDGITHIGGGRVNPDGVRHQVYIAFEPEQIKNIDNTKPTTNPDIRYSLSDSEGKQLSKEQAEYFKDSKIRDENGNLMVMYHGTPNGDFTVFKDGTYFTDNKEYADRYQNPGASSISTGKTASNPKTFEVYLDIKKPFDLSDAEARRIYIEDYIKGGNAMGINPYLSDAEYDKINTIDWTEGEDLREFLIENEYDYDGLVLDEGGTGGYGDAVNSRGKSYVVFSPEQVKAVDNQKPTANPDIRFSLSEAVEETKDLMAIHNLTGEKLLKSLKLGGLPMPSIAIARAKDGHGEFGEISLVLNKDTIDPQVSSRNKLYSGDAWTPTYPSVDYKPSEKVLRKVKDKISDLVPYEVREALGNLMFDTDNASDYLARYNGNMVEAYKQNDAMKYAYLKDTGSDISLPTKEADLYHYGQVSNEAVRYFSGKLVGGLQTVEHYRNMSGRDLVQEKALKEAIADAQNFDVLRTMEPGSDEYREYEQNPVFRAEDVSFRDIDSMLSAARKLLKNGVQQTVDRKAAKEQISGAVDQAAYENWLEELFTGVVEKEGIRNNKDYFTPSGNRRSFEALHYEHNLENVIKAMREQGEKGIGNGFGGASIFGASTTEFSSIEEMKQSRDRLQTMSYDEYQELRKGFTDRFLELAMSLPNQKNSFSATDSAAEVLTEAVAKYKTRSGIANYLRKELNGWATYSNQVVDDLIELVNDIRKMPTGYFESKPQRAVGFDEVGVFVIPYDADVKLKQELLNRGYSIAEYDPKVEGDRQRVLNQFEEYKFSLYNVGEEAPVYGSYNVYGKDVMLDTAPVQETVSKMESVAEDAPVAVSKTETTTEDLFPDDLAPVEQELESLMAERDDLQGAMDAYAAVGDVESVNQLLPEFEAVQEKIKALQQEDSERVYSLGDEDVPPEIDAPYPGEANEPMETPDPFAERDMFEVGKKNVKAYMYENPEVKPYFQEEALGMLGDLHNGTRGEKWFNGDVYYESGGEAGWGGTKRSTTADIADLLDQWHYTYDQIEKGLNAIIEDNGKENNAVSKRIEFMLHDRLVNGYTGVWGESIPANEDYINLLKEKQINEYSQEAFEAYYDSLGNDLPPEALEPVEDIAPVAVNPVAEKPTVTAKTPAREYEAINSKPKKASKNKLVRADTGNPQHQQIAKILDSEPTPETRKSRAWAKFKANVLDKGAVFEDLSLKKRNRELMGKWNFILSSEARAQRLMGNGNTQYGVKSLNAIREEVGSNSQKFSEYLYHKHNVDRMNLAERYEDTPNKPVFGFSVTSEVSQSIVDQYERKNPKFKRQAQDVYKYMNHLRQLMVDNGVISQETADLWSEMYPHYVPIRRADDTGLNIDVPLDTGRTGVKAPVKRATGGSSDILPLFDTMALRTSQTYKAIAKNSFGVELKNTLGSSSVVNPTSVDDVIDSIDAQDGLLQENNGKPTFTVFENGEKVTFGITKDMYDALKPISEGMAYTNKILNTASNLHRGVLTEYNPVFMLTNAIKDTQDVLINSQHPARTYLKIPEAYAQMLTKGYWYTEYMENGGEQNTYFDNETNTFKTENKGIAKLLDIPPLSTISKLNNFVEMSPRLAEYIASREAGRSVEVAMLDAARVTTNFAAGGDLTKFLNRNGATFLNASVQGAMQQVRNVREANANGLKGWASLATKFALAGLPAILLNNLVWDDDEEYEELSDYVKQNYYVVGKYGDGKFIRIPKGRTMAVIQEGIQQISNAATGSDDVDMKSFLELMVSNLAPNNPIENNILAPIIQVANNETWYGEDLVPTRLQDLPAAEQFDESTDSFSKWVGDKLDISPVKVNYLLDQYTGGIGDTFLPMLTPEAESGDNSFVGNMLAPLKSKFTTDSVMNNQNVSDFYDTKDELASNAKASAATDEDVLMNKYMNSINAELSDLYAQKREIQNSSRADDVKYRMVREVQDQIVDLTRESLATYEDVSITGDHAKIGDRYFQRSEEGEWQKMSEDQVTKYKVTSAAGDSLYATDGTNHYRWYEPGEDAGEDAKPGWRKVTEKELERQNEVTSGLGISAEEYWSNREEYTYAYDNPGTYALAKSVGGYSAYKEYSETLYDIKADKDKYGKSVSGSRKKKVSKYIYGLDIPVIEKHILFKSEYPSTDDHNNEIIDYLNSREDISFEEMNTILRKLDFDVDSKGNIYW